MGDHLVAAEKHAQHQATYEKWYGTADKRRNHTAEFFITAGVCAVIAGSVGAALASAGIVDWMLMPAIVVMGGFMSASLVTYGRMFLQMFRKVEVQRGELGDVWVACPNCGAPGQLTPGDAIDTCGHCHAALVPEQRAIQQGLDAAQRARRQAAIQHYRTEIETHARLYGGGSGRHLVFIVLVPFALMFTVPMIGLTLDQLSSDKPVRWEALLLMWGFVGLFWGSIALVLWLRWAKKLAIDRAMAPLCQQFQGSTGSGTPALAHWLLKHWAGPFPIQRLYTGVNHRLLMGHWRGYPILIDFHPARAEHMVRRASLMIAAEIPGVQPLSVEHQGMIQELGTELSHGNAAAQQLSHRLRQAGFDLRVSEAGFSASARGPLVDALRKHPERLTEWGQLVPQCVELVQALGGRPA